MGGHHHHHEHDRSRARLRALWISLAGLSVTAVLQAVVVVMWTYPGVLAGKVAT
jgi:hypothetical protein